MKNRIALFAICLALVAPVHAEEVIKSLGPEDEKSVVGATKQFIFLIDSGKYDESWVQIAPELQEKMNKLTYASVVKLMRVGVGDIKLRKLVGLKFIKDLKGAPPGTYAALFLES